MAGMSLEAFAAAVQLVAPGLETLVLQIAPPRFTVPPESCCEESILPALPEGDLSSSSNAIIPFCTNLSTLLLNDPGGSGELFSNLTQLKTLAVAVYHKYDNHLSPLSNFCDEADLSLPNLERLTVFEALEVRKTAPLLEARCAQRDIDVHRSGSPATHGHLQVEACNLFMAELTSRPM